MNDLKINYNILGDMLTTLTAYKNALADMEAAVETATAAVLQSKGEGISSVRMLSDDTKKGLAKYQEQIDDLRVIIRDFIHDMTGYVAPESRNSVMRVDSKNVKWSLDKIEDNLEKGIKNMERELNKTPSTMRVTESQADAYSRNRYKLEGLRGEVDAFAAQARSLIGDMWDLHNGKVARYQELDEEYAQRMKALHDKYTDWWEQFRDFWESVGQGIGDFFVGLAESLWGLVEGIIELVAGILKLAAAGVVWLATTPFGAEPQWVTDLFSDVGDTASALWKDPSLIWEGLGHSISDAWDEKGAAYCVGHTAGLVLPAVLTFGAGAGASAAGSVGRIAGVGGKVGKIAKATNAAKKALTMEELATARAAGTTAQELMAAGRTIGELRVAGMTVEELFEAGVEVPELAAAGVRADEIADAASSVIRRVEGLEQCHLVNR